MRILLFGRHNPDYSRNLVLKQGLQRQGHTIIECRVEPSARFWPIRLVWRFLRQRSSFDILFVAFPGQEVMLIARLLTTKPIVFDAFTSHYEGYVLDRKSVQPEGFLARWYHWLDRTSCRLADCCITDTSAHAQWFGREFNIPPSKFNPVFVGTDENAFRQVPEPTGDFTVHFHGHYIPLQGVACIIRAAATLRGQGIRFNLIGTGQTYDENRQLAEQLGADNITFIPNVAYSELSRWMSRAHVCLGIFGNTPKTDRVIPNKAFEALAMARPLVTADTSAIRELLSGDSAVLVPAADPQALAAALLRLRDDSGYRRRIGTAGRAVLLARATPAILGRQLAHIISNL